MQLDVRDLCFGWHEDSPCGVLSFNVKPGRLTGVVGPNGSGKNSLLLTLAGLLKPIGGFLQLTGPNMTECRELRQHSLYVGPHLAFSPSLTAEANLRFLCPSAEAHVVLQQFGVPRLQKAGNLSSGQRQRLRLACASLLRAPLLLLDEPGLALDAEGRELLLRMLDNYRGLVVLATNDEREATLADEIISLAG